MQGICTCTCWKYGRLLRISNSLLRPYANRVHDSFSRTVRTAPRAREAASEEDDRTEKWLSKVKDFVEMDGKSSEEPKLDEFAETSQMGPHVYKSINLSKSKEDLGLFLEKNIIFQGDGVIAINKPFGLGVRNSWAREEASTSKLEKQGKVVPKRNKTASSNLYHTRGIASTDYTLEDILPVLRTNLGLPNLDLVRSAEKYSSGVSIFSANKKAMERIQASIRRSKVLNGSVSSFWVVSTNIPPSLERQTSISERVGIGLLQNGDTKVCHPVIHRNVSKNSVRNNTFHPVSATLQLLSKNTITNTCCTEIRTTSTKSNFLRVYYADIATPILGDHLYSSRVKTVAGIMTALHPSLVQVGSEHQRLTKDVISALRLKRSEDSLFVPLHVHQRSLTLTKFYGKGAHLELIAPVPEYFKWTCRKLGLQLLLL